VVCLMIGYANQRSGDTYRMFDPVARSVYETRDIQWLGRMFWTKQNDAIEDGYYTIEVPEQLDEQVQVEDSLGSQEEQTEPDSAPDPKLATLQTRTGRQVKQPAFLQDYETGFFSKAEVNYYRNLWEIGELSMCGLSNEILAVGTTGAEFNNTTELKPMKYEEAMNRQDWEEWNEAVEAEHDRFVKHKVWVAVPRDSVPSEAKNPFIHLGNEAEV
jgi:hypothetical protein